MFTSLFGLHTLISMGVGVVIAVLLSNLYWSTKLTRCELNHERAMRELARTTAEQLARARAATDHAIAAFEIERRHDAERLDRLRKDIARLRPVRPDPEHRVLINDAVSSPHALSQTPSTPADRSPESPSTQGTGGPTDNLAEWAIIATGMYRACQDQIQALKTWTDRTFPSSKEDEEETYR